MNQEILGILLWPFLIGVFFLFRREYSAAFGSFIATVLAVPLLYWLQNIEMPSNIYLIAGGAFVVLTAIEVLYLRSKRNARKA